MNAKQFYNEILSKIKGGYTTRIAVNRARKHNLRDTAEEIFYFTGMTFSQIKEFEIKEGG